MNLNEFLLFRDDRRDGSQQPRIGRQTWIVANQFPSNAVRLLPILAIALRSVRAPEARHGLAAIVSAVERDPSLAPQVAAVLPDLQLPDAAGTAR